MIKKTKYNFTVDSDTTVEDIKKQYKRMSLTIHSDHGGSDDEFIELKKRSELYENHLEAIKDFYDTFTHSKKSMLKIVNFFLYLLGMNNSFSFIAQIARTYLTGLINGFEETRLLEIYIKYVETNKF